jgi:conjugal transfer pilus assembly protein TraV
MGGVQCEPMSSVYQTQVLGANGMVEKDPAKDNERAELVRSLLQKGEKAPIRLQPKVVRIWIAPWEDAETDLHEVGLVYSEIGDKKGMWLYGEMNTSTQQPILKKPLQSIKEGDTRPSTTWTTQQQNIPKSTEKKKGLFLDMKSQGGARDNH